MSNRKARYYFLVLLLLVEVWGDTEAERDEKKARREFKKAERKRVANGDDDDAAENVIDRFKIFKNNKKKHESFINNNKDNPVYKVDEESLLWQKTDAELELLLGLANITQIQYDGPKGRPRKIRPGKEKSNMKKEKKDENKKRAKKDKVKKPKEKGLGRETLRNKTKRLKKDKKAAAQQNKKEKNEARKAKNAIKKEAKLKKKEAKQKKKEENQKKKEARKAKRLKEKEARKATKLKEKEAKSKPIELVKRETSDIPSELDLRKLGYVGKVKNQKTCGSCWAFGAVCVIEGALSMVTGILPRPLSEQQIIHCNEAGYGCDGGFWPKAWKDIRNNNYIAQQRQQKYESKRDETLCRRDTKNGLGNELTVGTWSILKEDNDEEGMLEMLVDFGPITVTIYVNEEVFYYKSGYINSCLGGRTYPNHLVTMVGYEANTLILKNSWGRWWGDGGYFKIRRDCGLDGFSFWASFATVVPLTADGSVPVTEEQEVVVSGTAFNSFITLSEQAVVADLSAIGGLQGETLLVIQFNELDPISNFTISLHNRNLTSTSDIDESTDLPAFLDRDVRLLTYNTDPITLEWSNETQKCRLLTTMMEPPLEVILHEEEHACPLTPGSNFTVEIDVTASGYAITVGETELDFYPHRLDLENVTDFRMVYQAGPKVVDGVAIDGIAIDGVVMISSLVEILDEEEDELTDCFDKDYYCADRAQDDPTGCTTDQWMVDNCDRTCEKCPVT